MPILKAFNHTFSHIYTYQYTPKLASIGYVLFFQMFSIAINTFNKYNSFITQYTTSFSYIYLRFIK